MKKKILFYTDTPIYGGAEKQALLLAKFVDQNKYEITLCTSKNPALKEWQNEFKALGLKTIEIDAKHKHDPRHYFAVKKILKSGAFDLLHCHIWNPASCRYALQAAINTKTPIVSTEHDPFALTGLKSTIKRHQLQKIDQIICISEHNLNLMKELYPEATEKLNLIANGIDIEEFTNKLQKAKADKSDSSNMQNTRVITCIAALHERKGVDLLIEAFAVFAKLNPNYKLLIAGSGPEAESLKALAVKLAVNQQVLFLGQLQDIPQLLASSDFFVLPSRREAFGLVLLEAMCAQLPILATKTGGITEILSDDEAVLVEANSSTALLNGLTALTSQSQEQITQKNRNSLKKLQSEFSAKKMAEKTKRVYDKTIR